MSVSDADLELLESHLDGELSTAEEAALRHRLASEHVLDQELTSIRAERALRAQVFGALEPDDQAVKNLIRGVRNQITKESVRGDRMRILRYIASAAACVMLSFSAGWLGKARVNNQNTAQAPLAQPSPALVAERRQRADSFCGQPGPRFRRWKRGRLSSQSHRRLWACCCRPAF